MCAPVPPKVFTFKDPLNLTDDARVIKATHFLLSFACEWPWHRVTSNSMLYRCG